MYKGSENNYKGIAEKRFLIRQRKKSASLTEAGYQTHFHVMLLFVIYGIFVFFMYSDIKGINLTISNQCKFLSVVLCLFLSLAKGNGQVNGGLLLRTGLLFTVFSDYCMLLADKRLLGLLSFCVVQMLYMVRHGMKKTGLLLFAVYLIYVPIFGINEEYIEFTAGFYSVCLGLSVFSSFYGNNGIFATAGMVLFLLCDICVLLYNLPDYINESEAIFNIGGTARYFIWGFYLNSQVLIALSGRKRVWIKGI